MANCSDAFGTIRVEKVGEEFLEFLNAVQGPKSDAYYMLADPADFQNVTPNKNGDLEFQFSTMGRWSFSANLNGYLNGEWMNGDGQREAYDKFVKALEKKGGSVEVEYTDSDGAMDWMGTGGAWLRVEDGSVSFVESFEDESISISRYAEINGEDEYWALEYLKGDEVSSEYNKYVETVKARGEEPQSPEAWYETVYEE